MVRSIYSLRWKKIDGALCLIHQEVYPVKRAGIEIRDSIQVKKLKEQPYDIFLPWFFTNHFPLDPCLTT
jgi:hypothetical protein